MKPTTVVIVEDEPLHAALYQSVLKKIRGLRVFIAKEEQEALTLIRREQPKLVTLDLVLPSSLRRRSDVSFHEPVGLLILRQLKDDPKTKGIIVLITSNLDDSEHRRRALELGAAEYLIKAELLPAQFADRVVHYLG